MNPGVTASCTIFSPSTFSNVKTHLKRKNPQHSRNRHEQPSLRDVKPWTHSSSCPKCKVRSHDRVWVDTIDLRGIKTVSCRIENPWICPVRIVESPYVHHKGRSFGNVVVFVYVVLRVCMWNGSRECRWHPSQTFFDTSPYIRQTLSIFPSWQSIAHNGVNFQLRFGLDVGI